MPRVSEIKVRRSPRITAGDVTGWETVNPVLAVGELGLNTDSKELKVGDGYSAWNNLAGIPAGTLTTALPTSLGGSGASGDQNTLYSGPLSMISLASDYTLTGAGGTSGSFTTTDNVPFFPSGATLLANTVYDLDVDIFYRFTAGQSQSPRLSTVLTNGLTLQTSGCDIFVLGGTQTTVATPATFTKGERWNALSSATNLVITTTSISSGTSPGLKLTVRGVIRTSTAGTFNLGVSVNAGSVTAAKTVAGSYMKLTRIGTVGSSVDSIGTWV